MINRQEVVKKFQHQKERKILHATNPKDGDIVIKETDQFHFAGVVLRILEWAP